jgi:hypothetical protein
MKTFQLDQVQDKLAEALAEHVQARLPQDQPPDREDLRYLLHDLNSLLGAAGPGATLQPRHLRQAQTLLLPHLRSALEIPAQVLAKELPNRLRTWLKEEPSPDHPERQQWAEQGRWLLDQARTTQSSLS